MGRHDEEEVGIRGRHADGGLHHNKNNIEVTTMLPTVLMFSLPMVERFVSEYQELRLLSREKYHNIHHKDRIELSNVVMEP